LEQDGTTNSIETKTYIDRHNRNGKESERELKRDSGKCSRSYVRYSFYSLFGHGTGESDAILFDSLHSIILVWAITSIP
jgi:hypothetical protein